MKKIEHLDEKEVGALTNLGEVKLRDEFKINKLRGS